MSFCALAIVGLGAACTVRGASVSDLTGSVDKGAAAADDRPASGAAPGSDGVVRQQSYKCVTLPVSEPSKMALVPAGPFLMGCNPDVDDQCRKDELPTHMVTVSDFEIDITEVSQIQYYDCVASGACLAPTCDWDPCGARVNHPVVCVSRHDAADYCAWQKKRMPTEAEWEKAARGTDGLKFPWGNGDVDCTRTNMVGCKAGLDGKDGTSPVGSHPEGASPYGVLDMAGNVVEWVADYYQANYYAISPPNDPPGPTKQEMFVGRGGGWRSVAYWHRTSTRDDYEPEYFKNAGGFRCAK